MHRLHACDAGQNHTAAGAVDDLVSAEQLVGSERRQRARAGAGDEQRHRVDDGRVDRRLIGDPADQQATGDTAQTEHRQQRRRTRPRHVEQLGVIDNERERSQQT